MDQGHLNMLLGDVGSDKALSGEGVLRKIAHASEFAALGMVLTVLMEKGRKSRFSLLALCGLGAALIDETIQLFVDGRSGQIKDVWIDFAGFGIGVAIVGLILHLVLAERRGSCAVLTIKSTEHITDIIFSGQYDDVCCVYGVIKIRTKQGALALILEKYK